MKFVLSEIQLREVKAALTKLEAAHRARVAWFDDYSLEENVLSIHALDLFSVLNYCRRSSENEMDLFRLRKAAMDQLGDLIEKSRNDIKKQNYKMWLESYGKLWPGTEADRDLTLPPSQPSRIELIP